MAKKKTKAPRAFRHFDTTIPIIRPCRRCGAWLAAGIAEGIHVLVDLTSLDTEQAVFAVCLGIPLFTLTRVGLVYLDRSRMTDPRFTGRLPEHRCGMVWPSKVAGAGPVVPRTASDVIPF